MLAATAEVPHVNGLARSSGSAAVAAAGPSSAPDPRLGALARGGRSVSLDSIRLPKPNYSFPKMIGMALLEAKEERLPVGGIYTYIEEHFPYFRAAKKGWRNSVRHNLSLNKYFVKCAREAVDKRRGTLWGFAPAMRERMIRELTLHDAKRRRKLLDEQASRSFYNSGQPAAGYASGSAQPQTPHKVPASIERGGAADSPASRKLFDGQGVMPPAYALAPSQQQQQQCNSQCYTSQESQQPQQQQQFGQQHADGAQPSATQQHFIFFSPREREAEEAAKRAQLMRRGSVDSLCSSSGGLSSFGGSIQDAGILSSLGDSDYDADAHSVADFLSMSPPTAMHVPLSDIGSMRRVSMGTLETLLADDASVPNLDGDNCLFNGPFDGLCGELVSRSTS